MRIHMKDRREVVSPTRASGHNIQSTEKPSHPKNIFLYMPCCTWVQPTFGTVTMTTKSLPSATKRPSWSQRTVASEKDLQGEGHCCIPSGFGPGGSCSFRPWGEVGPKRMWTHWAKSPTPPGYFWALGRTNSYVRSVSCKVNLHTWKKTCLVINEHHCGACISLHHQQMPIGLLKRKTHCVEITVSLIPAEVLLICFNR